jgi:hypothetical protein
VRGNEYFSKNHEKVKSDSKKDLENSSSDVDNVEFPKKEKPKKSDDEEEEEFVNPKQNEQEVDENDAFNALKQ